MQYPHPPPRVSTRTEQQQWALKPRAVSQRLIQHTLHGLKVYFFLLLAAAPCLHYTMLLWHYTLYKYTTEHYFCVVCWCSRLPTCMCAVLSLPETYMRSRALFFHYLRHTWGHVRCSFITWDIHEVAVHRPSVSVVGLRHVTHERPIVPLQVVALHAVWKRRQRWRRRSLLMTNALIVSRFG